MSNAIVSQVPKNLLFRYHLPCRKLPKNLKGLFSLPEENRLPSLGEFEGQKTFADIRTGWTDDGFFVGVEVTGKQQSLWCRETQPLESDGLQLWIDMRNTHNVHRATKFCHWILLMPTGGGSSKENPVTSMLKINRSKEDSPNINRAKIEISSKVTKTGYQIAAHFPARCLHGWDTADHRQIGFNYAVVDRELGWQTLAMGPELPIAEDPSLWQSLQLVD